MKSTSILLVLALFTACGRGAQEGGCGRAGALRCDADGRHVSACTKGGVWRSVLDCGASNAACVDGRCVPQPRSNATRAGECTPKTWSCKDCAMRQYCSATGTLVPVGKCAEGFVCICGECKSAATYACSNPFICSQSAAGKRFPNPSNCQEYIHCADDASGAANFVSCLPTEYYDPCTPGCSATSICWKNNECDNSNNGQYEVVAGNPSQYYFCADGLTVLHECRLTQTFVPTMEDCFPPVVDCPVNRNNGGGTYDDAYRKKKHLTYDDCSTTGPNPSQCTPGEQFPHPTDPCMFYYCVNSADVREMTCPVNTKFDNVERKCVVSTGSCINT